MNFEYKSCIEDEEDILIELKEIKDKEGSI